MLAKSWEQPERHISVEYFGPNHPHDAVVSLSGAAIAASFFEPRYYVEVTSAAFDCEHLEREALARYGSVFCDPNIHRIGSRHRKDDRIVSEATAQDPETPVKDLQAWILRAIETKEDHSYGKPSILLVRTDPSRPLLLGEWCSVISAVSPAARASQFDAVVLVDWYHSTVHRAYVRRQLVFPGLHNVDAWVFVRQVRLAGAAIVLGFLSRRSLSCWERYVSRFHTSRSYGAHVLPGLQS